MPEAEKTSRIVKLNEDLIEKNDKLAEKNNQILKESNIKSFDIVGVIGAGKTALLEKIVDKSNLNNVLTTTTKEKNIKCVSLKLLRKTMLLK